MLGTEKPSPAGSLHRGEDAMETACLHAHVETRRAGTGRVPAVRGEGGPGTPAPQLLSNISARLGAQLLGPGRAAPLSPGASPPVPYGASVCPLITQEKACSAACPQAKPNSWHPSWPPKISVTEEGALLPGWPETFPISQVEPEDSLTIEKGKKRTKASENLKQTRSSLILLLKRGNARREVQDRRPPRVTQPRGPQGRNQKPAAHARHPHPPPPPPGCSATPPKAHGSLPPNPTSLQAPAAGP